VGGLGVIVVRVENLKSFRSVDGSEVVEVIGAKSLGVKDLSVAIARVEVGGKTLRHRHDFTEVYYIEKGEGVMHVENDSRIVGPGDFILIPKGHRHFIENIGDAELVIWCICAPAFTVEGTKLEEG